MSRYIDLDKAIPIVIDAVVDVVGHGISQVDAVRIVEKLEEIPIENVVKVRHGEWIFINQATSYLEPPYGDTLKCSLCEFVIDVSEGNYKYCPSCGAKMDGERRTKDAT